MEQKKEKKTMWRMENDFHTTKSRTRVILFSKSIGAF